MATLRDVARRADVSVCTVSRVLNGRQVEGRISDACARRVFAAAEAVGYRPNYHARSLQKGASRTVGLLVDRPKGDSAEVGFWEQVTMGVDMEARLRGYDFLVIGQSRRDESVAQTGLRYLRERRVDCLVIPGYQYLAKSSPELHSHDINATLVQYDGRSPLPVVEVDDGAGIAAAVEHLAELGHTRVLWLGPADNDSKSVKNRIAAFRRTTRARGMKGLECYLDEGGRSGVPGELASDALGARLEEARDFTAVVCYNERMAFGAYAAIHAAGLNIPGDISVVGFDDLCAHAAFPAMTVASHMLSEIGRKAAAIAMEMASDPKARKKHAQKREQVKSKLVIRSSTGRAPVVG